MKQADWPVLASCSEPVRASERLIIERHDIVSLGNHINHIKLVQHH